MGKLARYKLTREEALKLKAALPIIEERDNRDYAILELICKNPLISYRAIGEAIGGISRQAIHQRCKRMGIQKPHASLSISNRRVYDYNEIQRLRREEYLSTSQIMARVGCSSMVVHSAFHAAGIPLLYTSYPMLFSEEWVKSTLHYTARRLAEKVGCSKNSIYRARRRFGLSSRRRK